MSHFAIIPDAILRSNLDLTFNCIIELLTVSESETYQDKGKQSLVSSLRKTIIIHIASIIEALLLWKFKQVCSTQIIELADEWKYPDPKVIYKIDDSQEIIAGLRKKEKININRIDFLRTTRLCRKYGIISSEKLEKDIDKVRELRNRMHIGGLSEIENEYKKSDLKFCFDVAKRVKKLATD